MATPADFSPTVPSFDREPTMHDYRMAIKRAKLSDWRERNKIGKPDYSKRRPPMNLKWVPKELQQESVRIDRDLFTWNRRTGEWTPPRIITQLNQDMLEQ